MAKFSASGTRTHLNLGDIYFVSLDPAFGHEQRGFRPVLVLTPRAFNHLTGAAIVAAITTGGRFARRNGFTVDLAGARLKTSGVVRCDQIRTLDLTARNAYYVETAPDHVVDDVLDGVAAILDLA